MSKTKVNIRSFIIAPPKKVLLCADYSGQELRVLAHVAKEPTMIAAFLNNMDVHLSTANGFGELGIPDELLITTHPEHNAIKKKYKAERDNAKIVNFGIAYGKTKYGFAADWGWPVSKADAFIKKYFERFPKIKDAIDRCNTLVYKQKAIRNLTGRIRRFDHVDNKVLRQAFNFLVQGAAADIGKLAAGNVYKLCQQYPEWDVKFVMAVHDEYVWELYEDYVEEAMPIIKSTIENSIELRVPMVVDIRFGENYAEAKP